VSRLHASDAIFIAPAVLLCVQQPALAYIDPGTGSYLFQLFLGTLLAASVVVRVYWRSIRSFFSRRADHDSDEG